jgi:hypothetical protein
MAQHHKMAKHHRMAMHHKAAKKPAKDTTTKG